MKLVGYIVFLFLSVKVVGQTPLHFVELGFEPAKCRTASYQSGNGVVFVHAAGGQGPLSYVWLNTSTGQTSTNTTWGGLNPGHYSITVQDTTGNVLYGLIALDSVNPTPSFTVTSGQMAEVGGVFYGQVPVYFQLENTSQPPLAYPNYPGSVPYDYSWKIGNQPWSDSLTFEDSRFLNSGFNAAVQGDICLARKNKNECRDTLCKSVNIVLPPSFIGQNGVSFNTDISKQQLSIYLNAPGTYELKVFDPFGNPIAAYDIDGSYSELLFPENSGVYIYQLFNRQTGEVITSDRFLF